MLQNAMLKSLFIAPGHRLAQKQPQAEGGGHGYMEAWRQRGNVTGADLGSHLACSCAANEGVQPSVGLIVLLRETNQVMGCFSQ